MVVRRNRVLFVSKIRRSSTYCLCCWLQCVRFDGAVGVVAGTVLESPVVLSGIPGKGEGVLLAVKTTAADFKAVGVAIRVGQ